MYVHSVSAYSNGLPVGRFSTVSFRDYISCEIRPPEFHRESLLHLINGHSQRASTSTSTGTSTSSSTSWRAIRGSCTELEVAVDRLLNRKVSCAKLTWLCLQTASVDKCVFEVRAIHPPPPHTSLPNPVSFYNSAVFSCCSSPLWGVCGFLREAITKHTIL